MESSILDIVLGVIFGYLTIAILVVLAHHQGTKLLFNNILQQSECEISDGKPRAFRPSFLVFSCVTPFLTAVVGGALTTYFTPDYWSSNVLIVVITLLGALTALFEQKQAAGCAHGPGKPAWLSWITPLLGASGVYLGSRLF